MFYTLIGNCYNQLLVLIRTQDKTEAIKTAWNYRDTYDCITLITSSSGGLAFSAPKFDDVTFERIGTGKTEIEKRNSR